MEQIPTAGVDSVKYVFQMHGVDAAKNAVISRWPARGELLTFFAKVPAAAIGLEVCATSHCWARELVVRRKEGNRL